jgi:hypothetical protein
MLGKEFLSTLTSMNNLAGVLMDQGNYEEAEEMYLYLMGVHLMGVCLWACISCAHISWACLMGLYVMGMRLISMHLISGTAHKAGTNGL